MDDFIFYSIGSGSSGNSYFVGNGRYGFLIDAGLSARWILKQLRAIGMDIPYVRALLVTHIHKDHTQSMSVIGNRWNVPVFSTRKTYTEIDEAAYIHRRVDRANRYCIEHEETIRLGDFNITSFFVPHDVDDNSGFIIEYHGKTLVFATDIGHLTERLAAAVAQADYLVIESNHDKQMLANGPYPQELKQRIMSNLGHLSNDEAANVVSNFGKDSLRNIFLCHLSEENNTPQIAVETMRAGLAGRNMLALTNPYPSIVALERKKPQLFFLR